MSNKIAVLDRETLGDDLDLSGLNKFGEVFVYDQTPSEKLLERISDVDIIVLNKVKIDKAILSQTKLLKGICITATGTDNVDVNTAAELGIKVLNVDGYSTESVVEHTLAMYFHLAKKLSEHHEYIKSSKWSEGSSFTCMDYPFEGLLGKKWGIIGLGTIGRKVAEVASLLGAEIQYFSTSGNNKQQPYKCVELDELLGSSDVISLHCPLNDQTRNLIGHRELAMISASTIFLNVARGNIVSEDALAKTLIQKPLRVGFDVFSNEPLHKDSDLLNSSDRSGVLFTPHIAWASRSAREKLIAITIENIQKIIS